MKAIKVESFFKLSGEESKANKAAKATGTLLMPHTKRANVLWSFNGFSEFDELNNVPHEHVLTCLNATLEAFGRRNLQTSKDKSYIPGDDISLAAWFADYSAETTRTRAVTAATLADFGHTYFRLMQDLCGKPASVAAAGQQVIAGKFSSISGNVQAMQKMQENLELLVTTVAESETPEVLSKHEIVISALLDLIAECKSVPTADSL